MLNMKLIDYQYFFNNVAITKVIPKTRTIVAPEARLNIYESHRPIIFKIIPIIIEKIIIFFIL